MMRSRRTSTTWLATALVLTFGAAPGCATRSADDTASDDQAIRAPGFPAVMDREPGSTASDYERRVVTIRLLGVTPGDGTGGFATVQDRSTFATVNLRTGDMLGRNYRLSAMEAGGVDLATLDGPVHVPAGGDVELHEFLHRFDTAARYLGRHVWTVDGRTMGEIRASYFSGVQATDQAATPPAAVGLAAVSTVQLSAVDPRGVFGRLGFHEGSVLLAADGAPLHAADLDALAARIATPNAGRVILTVSEHGARYPLTVDVW